MNYSTDFNKNEIVYFATGNQVVKAVIEEIFVHDKVTELVVKYACRPYGMSADSFVSCNSDELYRNYEDVYTIVQQAIKDRYNRDVAQKDITVERFIQNNKNGGMIVSKDIAESIVNNSIEENYKRNLEICKTMTPSKFDELEKLYQKSLFEQKEN